MQTVIWLAPEVAKCITSTTQCNRADVCAAHAVRYTTGRPIEDFTQRGNWSAAKCAGFVSIADAREPASVRKIHPPIGTCMGAESRAVGAPADMGGVA